MPMCEHCSANRPTAGLGSSTCLQLLQGALQCGNALVVVRTPRRPRRPHGRRRLPRLQHGSLLLQHGSPLLMPVLHGLHGLLQRSNLATLVVHPLLHTQ